MEYNSHGREKWLNDAINLKTSPLKTHILLMLTFYWP